MLKEDKIWIIKEKDTIKHDLSWWGYLMQVGNYKEAAEVKEKIIQRYERVKRLKNLLEKKRILIKKIRNLKKLGNLYIASGNICGIMARLPIDSPLYPFLRIYFYQISCCIEQLKQRERKSKEMINQEKLFNNGIDYCLEQFVREKRGIAL
ncbi:MAG: hypothetical protein WC697_01050 [Patescibacteria group bacterium]|jgi:hypothetical protein